MVTFLWLSGRAGQQPQQAAGFLVYLGRPQDLLILMPRVGRQKEELHNMEPAPRPFWCCSVSVLEVAVVSVATALAARGVPLPGDVDAEHEIEGLHESPGPGNATIETAYKQPKKCGKS